MLRQAKLHKDEIEHISVLFHHVVSKLKMGVLPAYPVFPKNFNFLNR